MSGDGQSVSRDVLRIYTDGSCIGNPGPGGWAWVIPDGESANGPAPSTTNQRMEVTAVLRALERFIDSTRPIEIISDSTYVVHCFRDRWFVGWKKKGWKNSQGKPVANQDLWKPLISLVEDKLDRVSFTWVKGHAGDRWNEVVDQLAQEAAALQRGTTVSSTLF